MGSGSKMQRRLEGAVLAGDVNVEIRIDADQGSSRNGAPTAGLAPARERRASLTQLRLTLWAVLLGLVLGACADGDTQAPSVNPSPTMTPVVVASRTPTMTATPTPTPAPTDARGGVYLALGDSVTFGVGLADASRNAFPALVAERIGELDARVLAVPGETAAGFLERRTDEVEAAIAEGGDRVALVTIGLGANEILRIRRDPACLEDRGSPACQRVATDAAQEAAAALERVVERVQAALGRAGSDAPILLLAYYNPDVEPVAASTIVGADGLVSCDPDDPAPGLDDRIACVAERRETGLVDLYAAFVGREAELTGIGAGDVHPTIAGHEVIAEAIVDQLRAEGG